jgi:dUTP pyrophosphatase
MTCILLSKCNNTVQFTVDQVELTPVKMTSGAAGYDICSKYNLMVLSKETVMIDTGVSIAMPEDYYAQLSLRSSLGKSGLLMPNGVGIIDSDYRGVIKLCVHNYTSGAINIEKGQRVGQLVFIKIPPIKLHLVAKLSDTLRGTGGFGSTDIVSEVA